jgi:siroheme synthase-like protein
MFPLFLRLEGRRVVVVGAGGALTKKITELRASGALVTIVAPVATETVTALAANGDVLLHARAFAPSDLDDAWLVIAATNDAAVQAEVARVATERRIWLLAVDDVASATAYGGSVLRRAPFVVAISSSGTAPALTRLIREILESALPDESWVTAARALRKDWKAHATPMSARFEELVRAFSERSKQ